MQKALSVLGALLITAFTITIPTDAHALCFTGKIDAGTIIKGSNPWNIYSYQLNSWSLSGSGNGSTGTVDSHGGTPCCPTTGWCPVGGAACHTWTWSCTQHGTDSSGYLDCSGRQTSSGNWQAQFIAYCAGSTPEHSDYWVYNYATSVP